MARSERIKTLPAAETALFCEQVAIILKAGIPLYEGVETLKESYRDSRYGERFEQIYQTLIRSASFSDAVAEAGIFPNYMCAMIGIGERAGKLDEVMGALADYYNWEVQVRAAVKSAILYPVVLVLMLSVVIAVLFTSVLPVFSGVFESLGVTMGSASASAMRIGMTVGTVVLVAVGVLLIGLFVLMLLLRSRRRSLVFDWLCRALPPIGRASERLSAGRFCSVLSMMYTAGYHLDAAMELAPTVVNDERYVARIRQCAALMKEGIPIAEAMAESKLFQGVHEKLVRFGSSAGQLGSVMERLRDAYMQEADDSISRLVSLVEPTLVTILSVVIGGILLSVMLPLLSILSAMT